MTAATGYSQSVPAVTERSDTLREIVVSSRSAQKRLSEVQIGVEKIEISEIVKVPALFGERDVMKSIQLLPGVKSESDGSSGYQVRGGTSAQNIILLDEATVYNAGHLMGLFSAFNDDALTNASLYKGQIPAQYGGATSSVFDIHTKAGSTERFSYGGTIGLLSAKLNVDGPILTDRLSMLFSARRSYLDLFLKASDKYKDNKLNFYDMNGRIDYNAGTKDKLSFSVFRGYDNMGLSDIIDMKWGNTAFSARWLHAFSDSLLAATSLVYTHYGSDIGMEILKTRYAMNGYIRHATLIEQLTWLPAPSHRLNLGLQSSCLALKSAEWDINLLHQREKRNAWVNDLWVNDDWEAAPRLQLSAGIRLSLFAVMGGAPYYEINANGDITHTYNYGRGRMVKAYLMPQPRFSMKYALSALHTLKAGYSRTSQNIHAVQNNSMSMPFNRYTMSSNLLRPQTAHQLSAGYMGMTPDNVYDWSVEGYYKSVDNIYDYKDGKSFTSEVEIERLLLGGKGRAYGVEACLRKNSGRLTGWVAYTLSWAKNKIAGINGGRWYTASNDRRHDISIVGLYQLDSNWNLSATWVYNTGQALTAPSGKYDLMGETFYYYAERNGYRAPAYHRLDIAATHTKRTKHCERQWSFGLYNAYNHYNPYVISFENDDTKASGTKTVQTSLFGIIPSVSLTLKY